MENLRDIFGDSLNFDSFTPKFARGNLVTRGRSMWRVFTRKEDLSGPALVAQSCVMRALISGPCDCQAGHPCDYIINTLTTQSLLQIPPLIT